jgi:hypothetical protein
LAKELISNSGNYIVPQRFLGIDDKSYPYVKNVKRTYRRIGTDSIFSLLNRRLRSNAENDLKSLNSIHGALAHSGISRTYSFGDIKEQIRKVRRLVGALDKETFYHLRTCRADAAGKLDVCCELHPPTSAFVNPDN